MSSQYAVSLARHGLRQHNDPQQSARELVIEASHLNSSDNLTVIVVYLSSLARVQPCPPPRRRFSCSSLFEEGRNTLKSLWEGNWLYTHIIFTLFTDTVERWFFIYFRMYRMMLRKKAASNFLLIEESTKLLELFLTLMDWVSLQQPLPYLPFYLFFFHWYI